MQDEITKAQSFLETTTAGRSITQIGLDLDPVSWTEIEQSINLSIEGDCTIDDFAHPGHSSDYNATKADAVPLDITESPEYDISDPEYSSPSGKTVQFAEPSLFNAISSLVSERPSTRSDRRLSFEEELLLILRDDRGKKWQEISAAFEHLLGKRYRAPALQMRYMRLQKRLRLHTDDDMSALFQAHAHWANAKWETISERVGRIVFCWVIDSLICNPDEGARSWRPMDPRILCVEMAGLL